MISLLLPSLAAAAPYAVVVGADTPPPGRARLRYARADAEAVRDVLVEVGGFHEGDVVLLLDPLPDEVLAALAAVPPDADRLLLYYSGHADGASLFPHGRPLPIDALKAAVDQVPAAVRVGVVDACHGGGWTGAKGVTAVEPFEVIPLVSAGTAYLAASSGAEDAHELELLGGSVFTHHWVGGLRGAADADADGLVSLGESFEWARGRTIHDSTLLAGQTQHPSFHLDVRGRQDLVLTDLRTSRSTVALRWGQGEVSVRSLDSGAHVADLTGASATLALPPGSYVARRTSPAGVDVAEFTVRAGEPAVVDRFEPLPAVGKVAMKGDELAPVHLMSPPRARWLTSTAVGSWVGTGAEGALERRVVLRSAFLYGLTDHLALGLLMPGLGLSFGAPTGPLQGLAYGGFYDGGLGSAFPNDDLVVGLYGKLGGGLDLRRRLSPSTALVTSTWAVSEASVATDRTWIGPLRLGVGLGTELYLGPRVTLRPSLGAVEVLGPDGYLEPTLGGGVRRGNRPLPLLQVQLTDDGAWLDLDHAVRWDLSRPGQPIQETWVGLTVARGPRR